MGLLLIGCATVQAEPDKFVLPAGKHFFGDILVRADRFLDGRFIYDSSDRDRTPAFHPVQDQIVPLAPGEHILEAQLLP
jgi:hypothetical protein